MNCFIADKTFDYKPYFNKAVEDETTIGVGHGL